MKVVEMDGPGGGWRVLIPETRRERMRGLRGHPPPGPREGDALPPLPERADLRDEGSDLLGLPGPRDASDRGAPLPARPAGRRSASRPSRPRVRCPIGGLGRRPLQIPSRALTASVPTAATATRNRGTAQDAQLGSAIGSRRERSGSTRPSHSSTTRSSRCRIRPGFGRKRTLLERVAVSRRPLTLCRT